MHFVLDCDPGIDDAFALIYMQKTGQLDAVTTTGGNVGTAQTATNARWLLDALSGSSVPVAPGEPAPIARELITTPETHGEFGLGYVHPTGVSEPAGPWEPLWGTKLIVTGPLTNVARFRERFPERYEQIEELTIMGGAIDYPGNTTDHAEWNIWVDPEAAEDVFGHLPPRARVTLCPLNITEAFRIDPDKLAPITEALGGPLGEALPEIMRFYWEFHKAHGIGYTAQIHDLLTCLIACDAVNYEVEEMALTVDTGADRGAMTRTTGRRPVRVVTGVDYEEAHRVFFDSIAPR
ncbi:MAG: nucleoside hydrolase [Corynebacterium glucuronolyticum]|nr:nucleoside hydrolase [Corynebacterium glucuronolyticum]MDD7587285.1 nucleoside hydrolase [Mycobacteriaceae bacterium]MDY5834704.1 nucleoside hydrolase [Corynebacterium glucuronolyticum]